MTFLSSQWSNKKTYYVLAALMVIFALFRAIDIASDPHPDLSISGALYSDEGFKTYAARNMTLFDDWKWTPGDGYDGWLTKSPLTIYTYTRVFNFFGVSLSSIRLIAALYSLATILMLFFFVRQFFGNLPALIAAGLMGFNYFNIMFSRMGFYEIHLNFFIITACMALARASRARPGAQRILLYIIAGSAIMATWYIKRSVLIILLALIPVLSIYLLKARGKSRRLQQKIFYSLLGMSTLFYLIVAHSSGLHLALQQAMHFKVMGVRILNYIPFKAFSPLPILAARSFYLEFFFLQPIVFFLSFGFGLYTLFRFLRDEKVHTVDVLLSSWLVFGILLLLIMSYHPARYFVILSLPAAYLTMRTLIQGTGIIGNFLQNQTSLPSRAAVFCFKIFLTLSAGILVFVQSIPFNVRISHIKQISAPIIQGNYIKTLPVLAPYFLAEAIIVLVIVINRKRLYRFLKSRSAAYVLMALFLALSMVQYGAWFFNRTHRTRDLSQRLGSTLPPDTVLAGSWSAQMVLQNGLRALIMQDRSTYNHNLMREMIANKPIPARGPGGGPVAMEKDIPLYLVICPDVVFEQTIKRSYSDYIKQENLIDGANLGYFNIQVYRIRK